MSTTEERRELWGGETTKAVANFPVSGNPIPVPVIRWLGRIKATAARVNADLGLLDQAVADRIAAAGDEIVEAKAEEFKDILKAGRTHLMDAVPVTLGQEFGGYAAQIRVGAERVENALPHVAQIPLGGTATGTGLNTHAEFAERVRARVKDDTGIEAAAPADPFEAQGSR